VDYSTEMLTQAKGYLQSVGRGNGVLLDIINLEQLDILHLPYQDHSFDVALILNNTLGNLPGSNLQDGVKQRRIALKEARRILKETGILIVSVYNSARLTEEDTYGEVFELDHKRSNLQSFDLVIRYKATDHTYYSHWFSEEELRNLLYDVSFRVLDVEHRRKRIVIAAMKKQRGRSQL